MKYILSVSFAMIFLLASAQEKRIGIFSGHADVGNPRIKGAALFEQRTKSYMLQGGGYNIWFNRDEFHFVYKKLHGDFTLTAHFAFIDSGNEGHRKIGWMVRESLADSAVHISAVVHGDGLTVLQWRLKPGMNMRDPEDEIRAPGKKYRIIQLQRKGKKFIMRAAEKEGAAFITVGEQEMANLGQDVLAGLFICSHNPQVLEKAKAWKVPITK